jgi:hypothetical protein
VFNMIFAPNGVGLATRRDVGRLGRLLRRLLFPRWAVAASAVTPADEVETKALVATVPVASSEIDV